LFVHASRSGGSDPNSPDQGWQREWR